MSLKDLIKILKTGKTKNGKKLTESQKRAILKYIEASKELEKENKKYLANLTPEERKREKEWERKREERERKIERFEKKLSKQDLELRRKVKKAMADWNSIFFGTHRFRSKDEAEKWNKKVREKSKKQMKEILDAVKGDTEKIKKILLPDEWSDSLYGFKRYIDRAKKRDGVPILYTFVKLWNDDKG